MLLCGFEKFADLFVRIDILERLFMQIINSKDEKEIKMTPDMLNLLGCSKENLIKLLKAMNYKILEKDGEIFFVYMRKKQISKTFDKKSTKENPFGVLKNFNFN